MQRLCIISHRGKDVTIVYNKLSGSRLLHLVIEDDSDVDILSLGAREY